MARTWGTFPFGAENTERPARLPSKTARVTIIGVYPSAWHVSWTAPQCLEANHPRGERRGAVAALAVDVEPTVFWDGNAADFPSRLAVWKHQVGFLDGHEPGQHGTVSEVSPATNGSSGTKVVADYLRPLGVQAHQTGFTDVYPVFVVKTAGSSSTARGRRREQADAIRDEYDSVSADLNRPASSLPARPSPGQLPGLAIRHFGDRLVADLERIDAPLVVTLGKEAWATLTGIPQVHALGPSNFVDLYGEGYGTSGSLMINGRRVEWLPLVHPGLLKGEVDPDQPLDPARRSAMGWQALHSRWVDQVQQDSALATHSAERQRPSTS